MFEIRLTLFPVSQRPNVTVNQEAETNYTMIILLLLLGIDKNRPARTTKREGAGAGKSDPMAKECCPPPLSKYKCVSSYQRTVQKG